MSTLILRPIPGQYADPERTRIVKTLDSAFELTLGRSMDQLYGALNDPRISRRHVRLTGGPHEPPIATALSKNPIALIKVGSGERITLRNGEASTLSSGDELHLVVGEIVRAIGVSRAWLGNPCAYRVGLSSTALSLTPLDGRQVIRLCLDSAASLTFGRTPSTGDLGVDSWPWGIRDPRVSRTHARLNGGPNRPLTVHALTKSLQLVSQNGVSTVKKGGTAIIRPGDQLHLVMDEAREESLPWLGNPC
eukprot:6259622-Prymnesium_polylepis.1